jgi:hypothetical protein
MTMRNAGPLCVAEAEMRAELTHDRVSFVPRNVWGVGSRLPMIHEMSKMRAPGVSSYQGMLGGLQRCVRSEVCYGI